VRCPRSRVTLALVVALPQLSPGDAATELGDRRGNWWSRFLASRAEYGIPRARLSPSVALKLISDELVHTSTVAVSRRRLDSAHVRDRLRDEVVGVERLFESQGWIEDPYSFHREPPLLENSHLHWRTSGGVDLEHMTFASGYEPRAIEPGRDRWLSYEANRTAHAWVLRHRRVRRPWLVCVNGFRTGFVSIDLAAFRLQELHRQGLNVACYVLPLHGPRRVDRWSGDRFFRAGYINTIHGVSQAIWDLRRLLSWVRVQDTDKVGVYGLSLGGYTVSTLAAFEADLACVIAGIPATDFLRIMKEHTSDELAGYSRALGLGWPSVERILRVVAPLYLKPKIARNRRYIFGGLVDRIVDPTQVRDLWLHWDKPRIAWYQGSHFSFNREPEVKSLLKEALRDSGLAGAGI